MNPETIQSLALVLGPAGAAWVGVKVGLNGLRARVEKIEKVTDETRHHVGTHGERLARIETKLEGKP